MRSLPTSGPPNQGVSSEHRIQGTIPACSLRSDPTSDSTTVCIGGYLPPEGFAATIRPLPHSPLFIRSASRRKLPRASSTHLRPNCASYFPCSLLSFAARASVLMRLKDCGLHRILPRNKWQDQAMERNLGIVLDTLGYDHAQHSVLGEHHDNPMENQYLRKILAGRP